MVHVGVFWCILSTSCRVYSREDDFGFYRGWKRHLTIRRLLNYTSALIARIQTAFPTSIES